MYYIYSGSRKLSGFYPNDIPGVFAFRENDCYCFDNPTEAYAKIIHIYHEVTKADNVKRYGKYAKKHKSIAKNLKVLTN